MLVARGDHRADYTDLQDADAYNETVSSSILMNVQAEFDNLVHNIVTKFNEVLENAAEKEGAPYLRNEDGTIIQLFQRISSDTYDENGKLIREDLSAGKENTLFTISNLVVNPDLVKEPTKLGFVKNDKKEDYAIVSQVANTGAVFKSIYENEETTVSSTDNARQQVVGVSDEEELSNMIKFQNAYNASSRYINVIDQLLEHIINTLGA